MKNIIALLILVLGVSFCSAYEVKTINGVPVFAKWKLNSTQKTVWTDVERDFMIDQSSGTLTIDSFSSIAPTTEEQAIIDGIIADGMKFTRTGTINEINLRKSMSSQDLADYRKIIKYAKKKN